MQIWSQTSLQGVIGDSSVIGSMVYTQTAATQKSGRSLDHAVMLDPSASQMDVQPSTPFHMKGSDHTRMKFGNVFQ